MKTNAKLTILQIKDTHGYLDVHQEWFPVPQQPGYHLADGVAQHPTARRG